MRGLGGRSSAPYQQSAMGADAALPIIVRDITLRARTVQVNPASEMVLLSAGFEQVAEAHPEFVPSDMTEMSVNYLIELLDSR